MSEKVGEELTIKQIELYFKNLNIIKGRYYISLADKGIESKNYLVSVNSKNNFRYVLKIYSKSNLEEVKSETEILNKLNSSFKNSFSPVVLKGVFYINKNPSIILRYIRGHVISKKDISSDLINEISKKQSEMHRSLINFTPRHKKNRFSIFDFSFLNLYLNRNSLYYKVLKDEADILTQESKLFKKIKYTKSIIHEDLSMENIILSKKSVVYFIDFGESHRAEIISDIATAIKEVIIGNKGINFNLIRDYLDSYQKVIRLNRGEIDTLFFLLKRRTIFMIAYLLNKQEKNKNTELKRKTMTEMRILKILQKNDPSIRNFIKEYEYK